MINLEPDNAKRFNSRGLVYETMKDYDRVIVDYSRAIELDPTYAISFRRIVATATARKS